MEMKRVVDDLKWSKCTLIGHSQGLEFVYDCYKLCSIMLSI